MKPDYYLLRTCKNFFVCAEKGGNSIAVANRTIAREWETFRIVPITDNKVALLFSIFFFLII